MALGQTVTQALHLCLTDTPTKSLGPGASRRRALEHAWAMQHAVLAGARACLKLFGAYF